MIHKGYVGKLEFDEEAQVYRGKVVGKTEAYQAGSINYGKIHPIQNMVTFQGATPQEAELEFRAFVDDYLYFSEQD